jgi:hypothetical protein
MSASIEDRITAGLSGPARRRPLSLIVRRAWRHPVSFEYVFFAAFVAVVLFFAWRFFRSGSLTGALLGGSIEREFGEISLDGGALHSQKLKVYAMKSPSGERFVGVSLVAKARWRQA